MENFDEVIYIVYIIPYKGYGTTDSLGIYSSKVKYVENGREFEEEMPNEDFIIMDEIVLGHYKEEESN